MGFYTDKQTLDDLNLTGKYSRNSVFLLFNHTVTKGGERLLEKMFHSPLTSSSEINRRSALIDFFGRMDVEFPFTREEFMCAEEYFSNPDAGSFVISASQNVRRKALHLIAQEREYVVHHEGFEAAILFLRRLKDFVSFMRELQGGEVLKGESVEGDGIDGENSGGNESEEVLFESELRKLSSFLERKEIVELIASSYDRAGSYLIDMRGLSLWNFCRYDHLLRHTLSAEIKDIVGIMHHVDIYTSVGSYGAARGFVRAHCKECELLISVTGVYHPAIDKAVTNDITLTSASNLFFLTGANMAGKSTLMKSFSIAVYLAHMGFPVPCEAMDFTVMDGVYTSINVPDNLNMGYSHFYAEVMRVKMIAAAVAQDLKLLVVFDEMFKGTNVKDAFDATICVSEAFCSWRQCAFVVSTHIMEAAEELAKNCEGVQFRYLPTILQDGVPVYSYFLQDGVSDDRLGMTIVNNERIVETIKKSPFYEKVCVDV